MLCALALLVAALLFSRLHLGWLLDTGSTLDASGWQQLLQRQMLPLLVPYYGAWGHPPEVAAVRAAAAAAVHLHSITYGKAFFAVFAVYGSLLSFFVESFREWFKTHQERS